MMPLPQSWKELLSIDFCEQVCVGSIIALKKMMMNNNKQKVKTSVKFKYLLMPKAKAIHKTLELKFEMITL